MTQEGTGVGTWLEVTVTTSQEAVEAVSEMLMELGAGGVVVDDPRLLARRAAEVGPDLVDEPDAAQAWQQYLKGAGAESWPLGAVSGDVRVSAYLPTEHAPDLAALQARVAGLPTAGLDPGPAQVTTRIVHEEDWANTWKRYYTVQRIGRRVVIVPSWLEYAQQAGDLVIRLDPGMAFGTGTHPTTRLCLEVLEDLVQPGQYILDLGTGSGILAIAAAKLGARVKALDIDARAATVAAANAAANGVGELVATGAGTLATIPDQEKYDLVVANIVADTIITILPDIGAHLAPGGRFVASGIVENRLEAVKAAWEKSGLTINTVRRSTEWVCIVGGLK